MTFGSGLPPCGSLGSHRYQRALLLEQADAKFIQERFSLVLERTITELRRVPCIGLEEAPPDRKSIMASRSFGKTVETRQELEEALAAYTVRRPRSSAGTALQPAAWSCSCRPIASAAGRAVCPRAGHTAPCGDGRHVQAHCRCPSRPGGHLS